MSAKRSYALEENCKMLFERGAVRFWTFTLPVKVDPKIASRMWCDLSRDLVRNLGFSGVRVFELHPNGHGLHVHLLTSGYFDVDQVRHYCRLHGFGRVHVELCKGEDRDKLARYMSKYLSKQIKMFKGSSLKGMRWHATFGKLPDKVRITDVKITSFFGEIFKALPSYFVCALCQVRYPEKGQCTKKVNAAYQMAKIGLAKRIMVMDRRIMEISGALVDCLDIDLYQLRSGAWFVSQPLSEGGCL